MSKIIFMRAHLSLLLMFTFFAATAQELPCGVGDGTYEDELVRQQAIAVLKSQYSLPLPTLTYVAVKMHLFGATTAPSYLPAAFINNALAKLNKEFGDFNLEFYFAGTSFNYYPDSYFNSGQQTDIENQNFHNTYGVNNAINVYIQATVLNNGNSVGGYSYVGPTSQPYNRMYLKTIQVEDDRTFIHEMGHYFTLRHTFNNSTSTNISNRELVTRTTEVLPRLSANCLTAGDFICDTHADPYGNGDGNMLSWGCNYAGTVTDANLDPFTPHTRNYMSYHGSCAPFSFSEGQKSRIQDGYMLVDSGSGFSLDAPETVQPAPSNVTAVVSGSTITISWTDNSTVETGYIVEHATSPSGPFTALKGVGPNTTSTTTWVLSGITQHFRVKPSNSRANYGTTLDRTHFVGGIPLSIFPNPVASVLNFTGGKINFERAEVTNMAGQLVLSRTGIAGSLDVSGLQSGVYLIKAHESENLYYGKFVKQ